MEHKPAPVLPPAVAADIPIVEGFIPTEAEVKILRVIFVAAAANREVSVQQICDMAEVRSTQTYYNALKKKGFVESIKMYAVEPTKGRVHLYIKWMEDYAKKGSWPHLKALLAITDTYREGISLENDQVMAIIMPGKYVAPEVRKETIDVTPKEPRE